MLRRAGDGGATRVTSSAFAARRDTAATRGQWVRGPPLLPPRYAGRGIERAQSRRPPWRAGLRPRCVGRGTGCNARYLTGLCGARGYGRKCWAAGAGFASPASRVLLNLADQLANFDLTSPTSTSPASVASTRTRGRPQPAQPCQPLRGVWRVFANLWAQRASGLPYSTGYLADLNIPDFS